MLLCSEQLQRALLTMNNPINFEEKFSMSSPLNHLFQLQLEDKFSMMFFLSFRLLLNLNLGHKEETTMALGSLLDDNLFHEVMISRERR